MRILVVQMYIYSRTLLAKLTINIVQVSRLTNKNKLCILRVRLILTIMKM